METIERAALAISVVIPYYQRESGLLKRCVESVLAQRGNFPVQVIVVDDGSPLSAMEELAGLDGYDPRVTVICQANAGPGAARNNGLDHLPSSTRYVAFLDSDDYWKDDFLLHAMEAMSEGHDLFFANSYRVGFEDSRFDWHAKDGLNLVANEHQRLPTDRALYRFVGNFFDYALVRSNIISTSALVYRLAVAPELRFSTTLFNGQDRLFKLALCQHTDRVAFYPEILVEEGSGVNIYDNSRWGADRSIILVSNYIRLSKAIMLEIVLTPQQQRVIEKKLDQSRSDFFATLIHLLGRRKPVGWRLILSTVKDDPRVLKALFPSLFRALDARLKQVRS
uniref:glycosyltransferase family 2 protein n=1 Tax=Marinobacterium profundum TaxID=1714300 RepID=UPI00082E1CC7|nr:glycosyltransferase family 2 protein [Marinobacterium profundum]